MQATSETSWADQVRGHGVPKYVDIKPASSTEQTRCPGLFRSGSRQPIDVPKLMKKVGQSSTAFDIMMQTMRKVCLVLDDDGNGGPRIEVLFAASLGRIRLHGKKANLKGTFQKALNKIWPKLLTQRGLKVELPPATQQHPQSLSDDEKETSAIHLPLAVAIVLRITLQYTLYDTKHKTCSGKTVMTDALSKARLEQ